MRSPRQRKRRGRRRVEGGEVPMIQADNGRGGTMDQTMWEMGLKVSPFLRLPPLRDSLSVFWFL